ncbi:MAG: hypothetical protein PVH88_20405 [Ignavibacteria bacterium]|jgi:xylan 1,4-beta-xylosidase
MLEMYQIGYRQNDAYTNYVDMNRPEQLTKKQVEVLKAMNDGSPVSKEIVKVNYNGMFSKEFKIRENDVFLLKLIKF